MTTSAADGVGKKLWQTHANSGSEYIEEGVDSFSSPAENIEAENRDPIKTVNCEEKTMEMNLKSSHVSFPKNFAPFLCPKISSNCNYKLSGLFVKCSDHFLFSLVLRLYQMRWSLKNFVSFKYWSFFYYDSIFISLVGLW